MIDKIPRIVSMAKAMLRNKDCWFDYEDVLWETQCLQYVIEYEQHLLKILASDDKCQAEKDRETIQYLERWLEGVFPKRP